jgi:hypothetical protein
LGKDWLLQVTGIKHMSQILTWQASHDSFNTRDKDQAVGRAYGTNGLELIDIKNGTQIYLESAKRRISPINESSFDTSLIVKVLAI